MPADGAHLTVVDLQDGLAGCLGHCDDALHWDRGIDLRRKHEVGEGREWEGEDCGDGVPEAA